MSSTPAFFGLCARPARGARAKGRGTARQERSTIAPRHVQAGLTFHSLSEYLSLAYDPPRSICDGDRRLGLFGHASAPSSSDSVKSCECAVQS